MKVVFQYYYGAGGGLTNLHLLLSALGREYPNDRYVIVCSDRSEFSRMDLPGNVRIVQARSGKFPELCRLQLALSGLRRIAVREDADIIWSLNFGPYVRTGFPHVLSVHNAHQVYPWVVTKDHPDARLHVAVLRWFFRRSLVVSDGVITQTDLMAHYIRKVRRAPARIIAIPKAVENAEDVVFAPLPDAIAQIMAQPLGSERFTFLYVATSTPHKNHKTLLAAIAELREINVPARVVLSLTSDELRRIGGEQVVSLIDSGHVVPVGWVEKAHLRALYEASDACVMPSLLECLSSAHLETMQWGLPQVAADLPYARDLCGDAAVYARAEDPADWARQMQLLMTNAGLRASLVEAGHARMRLFPATWAEAATKVRTFLADVAGMSDSRPFAAGRR